MSAPHSSTRAWIFTCALLLVVPFIMGGTGCPGTGSGTPTSLEGSWRSVEELPDVATIEFTLTFTGSRFTEMITTHFVDDAEEDVEITAGGRFIIDDSVDPQQLVLTTTELQGIILPGSIDTFFLVRYEGDILELVGGVLTVEELPGTFAGLEPNEILVLTRIKTLATDIADAILGY